LTKTANRDAGVSNSQLFAGNWSSALRLPSVDGFVPQVKDLVLILVLLFASEQIVEVGSGTRSVVQCVGCPQFASVRRSAVLIGVHARNEEKEAPDTTSYAEHKNPAATKFQ
jgi:hypothetical protein